MDLRYLCTVAAGLALAACSDGPPGALVNVGGAREGGASSCASPAEGCACANEGEAIDCGEVARRSGDYVSCSMGRRTCSDGAWGACVGAYTTTKDVGGSRILGLGASAPCTDNPCDPDCQAFNDTATGLDAGAGLVVNEGGVTLSGSSSVAPPSCTSLAITPASSSIVVTSLSATSTVQLGASLLPSSCYSGVVPALWGLDQYDVAQVDSTGKVTLVTPIATTLNVSAFAGQLAATPATVGVTVNATDTSQAPSGYTNPALFNGATTADAVTLLYPYAGTMFPLGQVAPLLQWRVTTSASAVKVTLRYPTTGTPIFSYAQIVPELTTYPALAIAAQPRAVITQAAWFAFEQTVARNVATYGDTGTIALQRIVSGSPLRESTVNVRFAKDQLKGHIYYNSYGTNLVQNYGNTIKGARFGAATLVVAPGATSPSVVAGYTSSSNGPGCRVCHSVSPNGNALVTLRSDYTAVSYDLTKSSPSEVVIGSSGKYTWPALAPDGSYMLSDASSLPGSGGSKSVLYTLGGAALTSPATVFSNFKAATPSFSGDGKQVAFNFYGGSPSPVAAPSTSPTSGDGKTLSMMSFDASKKVFSSFVNLYTPSTGAVAWPSFLPPGQNGVVFEREIIRSSDGGFGFTRHHCEGGGTVCGDTGATAELWWVNTTGTPKPVPLANLNGVGLPTGTNLHGASGYPYGSTDPLGNVVTTSNYNDPYFNYEPTVLPIQAGGYSWVVFTSRRMYGNVATINPYASDPRFADISQQPTPKKLWIAAIANNPTAGADPSFPAFYLPGQELLAGNSRGYFALDACGVPGPPSSTNVCTTYLDCCGGNASPKTAVCKLDTPITNPPTRHCVSNGGGSCSADGGSCGTDADCCNFATGSRCSSGVCAVPPPFITYATTTFTREFVSACATGKRVVWRFYSWQATTPDGTSISFRAQTKEKSSDAYGAPVAIGAMVPPPNATSGWASGPQTVDDALRAAGQLSATYLAVTATLTPKTTQPAAAPTLTQWQQAYDCVDAQ